MVTGIAPSQTCLNILASYVIYKPTNVGGQMAHLDQTDEDRSERTRLIRAAELLGGRRVLRKYPKNPLEAHEMLLGGLPAKALTHFVDSFVVLHWDAALEKAVGMSQRTYQRYSAAAAKPLSLEQAAKTWKLAVILARATDVLGSREEAEQWLERPATGLDQRRPIDLLATPEGVDLVESYLDRIDYGVYT
jgi:putative toxin-antitoxin system antitoxin component (TIGR02293 family)